MYPKIVIAGFTRLAELARQVLKNTVIPPWVKIEISELPLQVIADHNYSIEVLHSVLEPTTILISGDRSSYIFSEKLDNLVIPVKVTGFDFLETIQTLKSKEVIVVNFNQNIDEITATADMLKVRVRQEMYRSFQEAEALFHSLKEERVTEIVGGSWACDEAERYGIKGIFYYSYRSLEEALNSALKIVEAYRKDMEKSALFKTIVDMNRSGVIATNPEMEIHIFSPSAKKLLGVQSEEVIGKKLEDVIPGIHINQKTISDESFCNLLINYNNKKLSVDIAPVLFDGENKGYITILDDVVKLQETELHIRKKLNQKSLVATYSFDDIIGDSEVIKEAIATAKKYSETDSSILIQGESGTGKELFAQSIHNASNRNGHAFVAVNCAALPENLLDSELFGYEEGAFTGARKGGKPGLFELAHKGTIFLDEIGELSLHLQSKLLRVIQEKEVMRIGGNQIIPVDVRIITATNRDLFELSRNKQFREDLYYRIGVLQLFLPPLKDRLEDIPLLVRNYVKNEKLNNSDLLFNDDVYHLLCTHNWPGNIRELENVIQRYIVFCKGESLTPQKVKYLMKRALYPSSANRSSSDELTRLVKEMEKEFIIKTVKLCGGNREDAAKRLGISRTTLWRKLKGMKIE